MMALIFKDYRLDIKPIIQNCLWQIGRASWGGRSREIWLVRGCNRSLIQRAMYALEHRPKTILFTPSETTARNWSFRFPGIAIALESVLSWTDEGFTLDEEFVTSKLLDCKSTAVAPPKAKPKRSSRTAINQRLVPISQSLPILDQMVALCTLRIAIRYLPTERHCFKK